MIICPKIQALQNDENVTGYDTDVKSSNFWLKGKRNVALDVFFFSRNFCDFSIFLLQLRGFFVAFHRLSKIRYFCDGMHAILGIFATTVISR